jgi:hypothetical protein
VQIGIDSFAAAYDESSLAVSPSDRLRHPVEQIEHADQVGLDVFGIGEHHRKDYLDSAAAVILGAAAARTRQIRLTSAVAVLSSADPVRLFQQFATLDLLSQGRAEMVVGRGSFIDSFPLFGFRLGTTTRCSPRSSICSSRFARTSSCTGREGIGRLSRAKASTGVDHERPGHGAPRRGWGCLTLSSGNSPPPS